MVIIRENQNRVPDSAEPTLYEEMALERPGQVQIIDPIQGEILVFYQNTVFENQTLIIKCFLWLYTFGIGTKTLRIN